MEDLNNGNHIRRVQKAYSQLDCGIWSCWRPEQINPCSFLPAHGIPSEEGGVIQATAPGLRFKDGAVLQVLEIARLVNAKIELLKYTYHYERPNGYFFRYEREDSADLIRKPEYHMHVILDLPHFPAPPVDLEIILEVITNNFYSQEIYSRQIIDHEIHLTV